MILIIYQYFTHLVDYFLITAASYSVESYACLSVGHLEQSLHTEYKTKFRSYIYMSALRKTDALFSINLRQDR